MTGHRTIRRPIRAPNPPGLPALGFRVATQPLFLRWMLSRLAQGTLALPDRTRIENNPLQSLNPDAPDAFVPSLLSAWAAVGDVLTFYQERIANEGYLGTATEVLSVRQLVSSIGVTPRPALSATTHLAFSLIDGRGAADRVSIPKGTAVRSVPPADSTAVVFETDRDIEARRAWNAMTPLLPAVTVAPPVVAQATRLRVAGVTSELRPGMPILLHGKRSAADMPESVVRELVGVETNAAEGSTLVSWREPIEGAAGTPPFIAPELLAFRSSARLFGAGAPDWARQPDSVKAQLGTRRGDVATASAPGTDWAVANHGLPPSDVGALAIDRDGILLAAAGDAILRHVPPSGWAPLGAVPRRTVLTALIAASPAVLYAGTRTGDVLGSTDGGASWLNLTGPAALAPSGGKDHVAPPAPVRALAVVPRHPGPAAIAVGTAFGLWCVPANGGAWTSWNDGLPGYDTDRGGASAAINAVARHPVSGVWVAATDQGLFHAAHVGARWHPAALPTPMAPPRHPPSTSPAADSKPVGILCALLSRFGRHSPDPGAAFPSDALAALPSPTGGASPAAAPAAYCLAVLADDPATVLAGTADGVRRSTDGKTWQPAEQLAAGSRMAVTHLAADRNGVVAGTADGLFQSLDHGATWTRAAGPFAATAVTSLAAGAGRIVAAAPFRGYQETEWPGLLVSGKQIDLDRAYPALVPGSWIVLAQDIGTAGGTTRSFVARKVVSASLVQRRDFQLAGRVTRVIVDPPLGAAFDPRT
ncbi:MAG: hypothetical protein ABSG76_26460, partial [Xanthobacteraceae bacterium]